MSATDDCMVHPLKNGWVVYEQIQFYDSSDKRSGYKASFEAIYHLKNVESFWLNWSHFGIVSELFYDGDLRDIVRVNVANPNDPPKPIRIEGQSIFKQGIFPFWDEAANSKGGELRVTLDVTAHDTLSKFWETVVLLLIGETLVDSDEICGARILDKSKPKKKIIEYRLEIWFSRWDNEVLRNSLKERIEAVCKDFDYKPVITFEVHDAGKWKWIVCCIQYLYSSNKFITFEEHDTHKWNNNTNSLRKFLLLCCLFFLCLSAAVALAINIVVWLMFLTDQTDLNIGIGVIWMLMRTLEFIIHFVVVFLVTVVLNNRNKNKGCVFLSYLCYVSLAVAFSYIGTIIPASDLVDFSATVRNCFEFVLTVQYFEFIMTLFVLVSYFCHLSHDNELKSNGDSDPTQISEAVLSSINDGTSDSNSESSIHDPLLSNHVSESPLDTIPLIQPLEPQPLVPPLQDQSIPAVAVFDPVLNPDPVSLAQPVIVTILPEDNPHLIDEQSVPLNVDVSGDKVILHNDVDDSETFNNHDPLSNEKVEIANTMDVDSAIPHVEVNSLPVIPTDSCPETKSEAVVDSGVKSNMSQETATTEVENQPLRNGKQSVKCCCCHENDAVFRVLPCEDEYCSKCVGASSRCTACGAIITSVEQL